MARLGRLTERAPRRALSLPRRLLYSVAVLVLFFLCMEGVLWGVSLVVYHQRVGRLNPQTERTEGVFRIVTFGDSVTAGQGTAPQYSYPRQLEELLRTTNPDGRFEVINNGVYALNSSRLADLLPGWLDEFQPDAIVVMTGCNNAWNYRNSHLDQLGDLPPLDLARRTAWQRLLDRTRTYRFLRVALKRRKQGFGISVDQEPEPVLRGTMQISASVSPAVDGTAKTLERQEQVLQDREALDKLLSYDLDLMASAARARRVPLVLMTYPFDPPYQDHYGITHRFAQSRELIEVDNLNLFRRAARNRPDLDLFSADRGHPNATGYRVVAWNIYEALRDRQTELGLDLGPPPDPIDAFKDRDYLEALYLEVEEATRGDAADEYTWETLGHVAMELDDIDRAQVAFRRAFEISGGSPQFYESLGALYARHERWDDLQSLVDEMQELRGGRNDIEFQLQMFERELRRAP